MGEGLTIMNLKQLKPIKRKIQKGMKRKKHVNFHLDRRPERFDLKNG